MHHRKDCHIREPGIPQLFLLLIFLIFLLASHFSLSVNGRFFVQGKKVNRCI